MSSLCNVSARWRWCGGKPIPGSGLCSNGSIWVFWRGGWRFLLFREDGGWVGDDNWFRAVPAGGVPACREREAGLRVSGNFTSDERKPIKLNDLGGEQMVKFAGLVWSSRAKRLYKFSNGGVYRVNL